MMTYDDAKRSMLTQSGSQAVLGRALCLDVASSDVGSSDAGSSDVGFSDMLCLGCSDMLCLGFSS